MDVVATILIIAATVAGVLVARSVYGPLKFPAYALAAWLAVLLLAWPLSATGHLWRHGLALGWILVLLVLSVVVVVTFYGFVAYLLIRAVRAIVHRLR